MPQPERSVVAVAPPATGRGDMGRRAQRGLRRRGDLPGVPAAPPGGAGPRLRGRGGALGRRRALRDPAHHPPGGAGRRVAGAPGDRADPGRGLAAVPELRHAGHQALARGGARGRHPGAFDARRSRVVLPGDAGTAVKDPVIVRDGDAVAPLGVGAPAGRPRPDRPDGDRLRVQLRRPGLDLAGHRAEPAAGRVGLRAARASPPSGSRPAASSRTTTGGPARPRTSRSGPASRPAPGPRR